MNQIATIEGKIDREVAGQISVGSRGVMFRTGAEVMEVAKLMSVAGAAVPKHLRGNPGACLAVTMSALRWEMDPFAVASKTYLVSDTIAYEGQLVMAVLNTRAPLSGRMTLEWSGEGAEMTCRVSGTFTDGTTQVYESPPLGSITPKNSPLWKTDPRRQLGYWSSRAWGRLFCPEVLLGVYTQDELDDTTPFSPARRSLADRMSADTSGAEGFDHDRVRSELSGTVIEQADPAADAEIVEADLDAAHEPDDDAPSLADDIERKLLAAPDAEALADVFDQEVNTLDEGDITEDEFDHLTGVFEDRERELA